MHIAALLTCYNRRQKTLDCIESLVNQRLDSTVNLTVILVDDGSTDGTSDSVASRFPLTEILKGDGSLFWNGGMRKALATALSKSFDGYILVNDDVRLNDNAVRNLLATYQNVGVRSHPRAIIVGSTSSPNGEEISYGGLRKGPWWKPLKLARVPPSSEPVPCDTFNCNCVLIPRCVAEVVGNLDSAYTHGMGDFDYGFRAAELGCSIWVAPGIVGECQLNQDHGLWADPTLSLRARWKRLTGPKGLPLYEWLVFTRRHSGPLWLLYWLNPYLRFWLTAMRNVLRRHNGVHQ